MERSSVAIGKCQKYDIVHVKNRILSLIKKLGGIDKFLKTGESVLLKPNLLADIDPEKAATTHPVIVEAVVQIALDFGAKVALGDSPAIHKLSQVLKKTGMAYIIKKYNIQSVPFVTPHYITKLDNHVLKRIPIAKEICEFDSIINLCKLKSHVLTHFTGALKNMYGIIPGLFKSELHLKVQDPKMFANLILDIYRCMPPSLSIMDGIVGMEGMGPRNGKPKQIGVILASEDSVALDSTALRVVGVKPDIVPTLQLGALRQIGNMEQQYIDIRGESLSSFTISDFDMPQVHDDFLKGYVPAFARKWLKKNLANFPKIKNNICTLCRQCLKICPADAIIELRESHQLYIVEDECIRCFCCMEICPHDAVGTKQRCLVPLMNLLKRYVRK